MHANGRREPLELPGVAQSQEQPRNLITLNTHPVDATLFALKFVMTCESQNLLSNQRMGRDLWSGC